MIPNIGPMEILIVLAICLIIFGPRRLPELGKSAGKTLSSFRESLNGKDSDAVLPAEESELAAQDAAERASA